MVGEYLYLYEYYPAVVVCPGAGRLIITGTRNVNVSARPIRPAAPPRTNARRSPPSAPPEPPTPAPMAAEVIDSQINGAFEGWDGETVFRLVNGQIWQQASYAYTYHYSYMPRVLIFRAGGGYQMQVEGVQGRIAVRQLR